MAIVLVKMISTDNGAETFEIRSTLHTQRYAADAVMFSEYLKDCKSYETHVEHGELYTVISHLLKF